MEVRGAGFFVFVETGRPLLSNPWMGEVDLERDGLFRGIGFCMGGRATNFKLCFQPKI